MGHLGGKRTGADGRVDKPIQLADGLAYVHGAVSIEMIAHVAGTSLGMDRGRSTAVAMLTMPFVLAIPDER
jgi:hypothetical protein